MAVYFADQGPTQWQRPPWPYRLNGASPQARDLLLWIPGGARYAWGTQDTLTPVGGAVVHGTTDGLAYGSSNFSSFYWTFPAIAVQVPFTLAAWAIRLADNNGQSFQSSHGSGANYAGCNLNLGNAGGWNASYGNNTASGSTGRRSAVAATDIGLNQLAHVVAVCRGATDWSLYTNGKSETPTYSGSGGSLVNGSNPGTLGRGISGSGAATAAFIDLRVYNRAFVDAQAVALYNPATRWDLYARPSTRVYFDIPSGVTYVPRLALLGVG